MINEKFVSKGAASFTLDDDREKQIFYFLLEYKKSVRPTKGQKKLKITANYVKEALGDIVFDEDLSRYIL